MTEGEPSATADGSDKKMPVCIAGMHRSGTSMAAHLLHLCGLYLGADADLMSPTRDNERGYWENIKFEEINDRILDALGGAWDYPPPPLGEEWREDERLRSFTAEIERLAGEFTGHEFWGWKDPRTSLTLPVWTSALPHTKTLVCLRNPLEVAFSLRRREPLVYKPGLAPMRIYNLLRAASLRLRQSDKPSKSPSFIAWKNLNRLRARLASPARRLSRAHGALEKRYERVDFFLKARRRRPLPYRTGLRLWETYNLRILEYTLPRERIITHYDAYFPDPRAEVRRVLKFLDMPASEEDIERCRAAVSTGLRHNQFTMRDLREAGLPAKTLDLYARMCEEAEYVNG